MITARLLRLRYVWMYRRIFYEQKISTKISKQFWRSNIQFGWRTLRSQLELREKVQWQIPYQMQTWHSNERAHLKEWSTEEIKQKTSRHEKTNRTSSNCIRTGRRGRRRPVPGVPRQDRVGRRRGRGEARGRRRVVQVIIRRRWGAVCGGGWRWRRRQAGKGAFRQRISGGDGRRCSALEEEKEEELETHRPVGGEYGEAFWQRTHRTYKLMHRRSETYWITHIVIR